MNEEITQDEAEELFAETVNETTEAWREWTDSGSETTKAWVPYEGDRGGTGWQNTEDPDEIVYDDEPPGEALGLTQVLTDLADVNGSDASAIMDNLDEAVDALDLNEEGRAKVYTEFAAKIVRDAARAGKPLDEFDPSQFLGYAGHVAEEFIEENRGEIDDKYIDDPYDDVPIEGPSQLAVGDKVQIDDLTGELVGVEQVNDPDYIDVDFGRGEPEEYFVSDIDEVVDISEREWSTSEISHADTQAINSIEGYQIQNDIEEVFGKFGDVTGKVEDRVLFDDDVDESDPMNWYEAVFDVTSEMDDVPKQKAQQFADTVDNRIKGTQLDDMDTREQLQNGFELYEERNDWYDVGSGGNTTGDQMEVLDMPDGSRQFAIPVNAYNRITTGVVRGPDEAVQNNLNAPKAIEALGGHAATTEVVQDPETGDDYIVKEGIPGYDVSEARKQGIDVAPGYREDAKATLAAAWFIGNGDLHYGNMRIAEDGRLVVIDHDSAGSDRMDPQDPETAPAGPPGIHSPDVSEKAIDIAAEIELGDMDLPDDIPMWMQDEIMKRVEGAIEYANNIGYDDLPEELQRETAADRGIDMTEDIDVGDLLEVQPEYLNRKVQGEVDRIEYGNLYIQDANGLEYEIENESEILELI